MRDKIFAQTKFNLDALLSLAAKLRGRPCTCDASQKPKTGSHNWIISITFDDGVEWVFRSPRVRGAICSDESASKMLISEASTIKYLRIHSSIPVPDVYSFRSAENLSLTITYRY